MKYSLEKIRPRIYCVQAEHSYDLAMLFVRYQEFYESSSSRFKGKRFTLLSYMEWYAKEMGGGVFTYPNDWQGFNLPSTAINSLLKMGIGDWNEYDTAMSDIKEKIEKELESKNESITDPYYIIGILKGDDQTLYHEVAHGLYATNKQYLESMKWALSSISKHTYDEFENLLLKMGYCKEVVPDEMQAYMSTGLTDKMQTLDLPAETIQEFVSIFKNFEKDNV